MFRWRVSSKLIDEVWVNSNFVKKIFKNVSKNVKKIPFYLQSNEFNKILKRKRKIKSKKFVYSFVWHFLHCLKRFFTVSLMFLLCTFHSCLQFCIVTYSFLNIFQSFLQCHGTRGTTSRSACDPQGTSQVLPIHWGFHGRYREVT